MHYGLQLSKSGAATALYMQDVYTANLANLTTPGFKADVPMVRQRAHVREEDGVWHLPSNRLLERLGAGTMMLPNQVDFKQGALRETGNELDVAIRGEGFFAVRDARSPENSIRLTRDGRFGLDARGRLVQETSGLPVLDRSEQPIFIDPRSRVEVAPDGQVVEFRADGREVNVAYIGLFDVANRGELVKRGAGLFEPTGVSRNSRLRGQGDLVHRALEQSSVNEISAMMAVQGAARVAQGNMAMIGYHNDLSDKAINVFGRAK